LHAERVLGGYNFDLAPFKRIAMQISICQLEPEMLIDKVSSGIDFIHERHRLELFYYVAKHGGIAQAILNMPYSIQHPTIGSLLNLVGLMNFIDGGSKFID
jgi:hypothetical protein